MIYFFIGLLFILMLPFIDCTIKALCWACQDTYKSNNITFDYFLSKFIVLLQHEFKTVKSVWRH